MTSVATLSVYYNGSCPICRAEIAHYTGLAARTGVRNLVFHDLTENPDALTRHGLTPESARRRLYAQEGSGALISGIDSFIAIWTRLPAYRWLARLARLPVFYHAAGWIYDRVAVPLLTRLNARREARAEAR